MSSTIDLEILRYGALEQYTATAVDFEATDSPATTRVASFRAFESVHRGHSQVQRGHIRPAGSSDDAAPISGICKLTMTHLSELRDEAELYATKLRDLQGKDVPICYGYFECQALDSDDRKRTMGCLILEDCGAALDWELQDAPEDIQYVTSFHVLLVLSLTLDFRIEIVQALDRIHVAGVQHNDIKPDNIVVTDSSHVRIIDFGLAMHHNCKRRLHIDVYDYQPFKYKFGCYEMYEVVQTLGLWTPSEYG